MKTLHLTNSWHATSGGIATFYRALMAEANRRKQPIRLVVPGGQDRIEECGELGRIYHVKAPRALLNRQYRSIYPTQFLSAGSKLQAILRTERPNLVEICDKYTLNYLGPLLRRQLSSSIAFRPVVIGLSCERMDDNFRTYLGNLPLAKYFCSAYMRWIYFPFFDHHIANSEYTAAELRSASSGHLIARGTWVRHMGVDLRHLSPQLRSNELRRRLLNQFDASDESVLLLYVGRLVPEKNLTLLFDLMGRLTEDRKRDFRLLVVGEGIERKRWEEDMARQRPGRVRFLGHISDRTVLADLYANSDVFIHPNAHEPFGIAPLEAMASGLPLLAPKYGGITSYANDTNAWLAEPTTEGFMAALEAAVANPEQTAIRTNTALQTARHYDWNTVASSFLDLYDELYRCATQSSPIPEPAFWSTPARGARSWLVRRVAASFEKTFKLFDSGGFRNRTTQDGLASPDTNVGK